jgi:hypothetical protein
MEKTSIQSEEAAQVFNKDQQDLYALLVPDHIRTQAFSKEGLIAKGQ